MKTQKTILNAVALSLAVSFVVPAFAEEKAGFIGTLKGYGSSVVNTLKDNAVTNFISDKCSAIAENETFKKYSPYVLNRYVGAALLVGGTFLAARKMYKQDEVVTEEKDNQEFAPQNQPVNNNVVDQKALAESEYNNLKKIVGRTKEQEQRLGELVRQYGFKLA